MKHGLLPFDPADPGRFSVIYVQDPKEMDTTSRLSGRLPTQSQVFQLQLLDRTLLDERFVEPITSIMIGGANGLLTCQCADKFANEAVIRGDISDLLGLNFMLQGKVQVTQAGVETVGTVGKGLVFRPFDGTRVMASDGNIRRNLWVRISEMERVLEQLLGDTLPRRLAFESHIDWSTGLAASLKIQIEFLMRELVRPGGVASNALAMAYLTDLIHSLVLSGVRHNYSDQLAHGLSPAVPIHLRRAEDFMSAHATSPIRLADIAAAAGCSVRTLNAAFRRFRDTTPLAALHALRLDQVRVAIAGQKDGASTAILASRFGFTNAWRFAAAYRARFGESPADTASGLRARRR
jgi:AraC-like DNA-binding protein